MWYMFVVCVLFTMPLSNAMDSLNENNKDEHQKEFVLLITNEEVNQKIKPRSNSLSEKHEKTELTAGDSIKKDDSKKNEKIEVLLRKSWNKEDGKDESKLNENSLYNSKRNSRSSLPKEESVLLEHKGTKEKFTVPYGFGNTIQILDGLAVSRNYDVQKNVEGVKTELVDYKKCNDQQIKELKKIVIILGLLGPAGAALVTCSTATVLAILITLFRWIP